MSNIIPTQKPVPSNDIKDLLFNSGLLDEWATSVEHEYIDRFGSRHLTAAGMEWTFKQLVEKFNIDMDAAIRAAGYVLLDSFQQGVKLPNNELTQRNHALRDERTGEYYRWNGALPKQVLPGSTPESTGGVSVSAWVGVGDASLRAELATQSGAGIIGTISGLTVEDALSRQYTYAIDFLPTGYVSDGSVSYTNELQRALYHAAKKSTILVMPPFECLIDPDGSAYGGLIVPTGSDIVFLPGSKLRIKPNDLPGYEILGLRDVENVRIYRPIVQGDKYTHTGKSGEFGMGISIRGACKNITIVEPETHECWGDGIYIGQTSVTIESTPENLHIVNPVALRNRRQGISVTSAKNLTIDNPELSFTKSSDSPVSLPGGPHAGIDIEPNSFNSLLENIVINGLSGKENDAGLFYIYLGGCENNSPSGGAYHVDIKINGLSDNGSGGAVYAVGASKNISYSGAIYVNNLISRNSQYNGIRLRSWPANSIPIYIDGATIIDWNTNPSATAAINRSAVSIYQNVDPSFPAIGNLFITGLSLLNWREPSAISENIIFTSNQGGAGIKNVDIKLSRYAVNRDVAYIQSQAGVINFNGLDYGDGPTRSLTSSWIIPVNLSTDILVDKPEQQLTVTLPSIPDSNFNGYRSRVRITPGGYPTFRLRAGDAPLIFNGVKGSNFLVDYEAGVVDFEYDGYCFYATSKGPVTKES